MTHLCSGDRAIGESNTGMNTIVQVPPRQLLVAERLRRRWTQLEVADQLGTTPGNVSRWERGTTSPGPYFRSRLCELFGKSARELGLTWDESNDALSHQTQISALATLFQRSVSARSNSSTDRENLPTPLHALIRPDTVTVLPSVPTNSRLSELNLPEQENEDQVRFAQAVAQWLQASLNRVLIPVNAGAMVLVVLNSNADSRPTSPQKSPGNRHTMPDEDCCDEYSTMQESLRQRRGA